MSEAVQEERAVATPIWMDYFMDPDCAQCWAFQPTLEKLMKAEGESLRPHLFMLPRDAEAPGPAARAIKAAGTLGGGAEFRLLEALRPLLKTAAGEELPLEAARRAGLDEQAFRQALAVPVLAREIAQDRVAADELGIAAAPAVVLRNDSGARVVIEGLRNFTLFKQAIDALRAEPLPADAGISTDLRATPIMPEIAQLMPDQAPTG